MPHEKREIPSRKPTGRVLEDANLQTPAGGRDQFMKKKRPWGEGERSAGRMIGLQTNHRTFLPGKTEKNVKAFIVPEREEGFMNKGPQPPCLRRE